MMQPSFSDAFLDEIHQPFDWHAPDDSRRRAALLVHGFPGTPAEMRGLAQHLHGQGWAVRGILLPGFGIEIDSLAESTYDDWRFAVETALADLMQRYDSVMVVGHSMGGALAIRAAARLKPDYLIAFAPFWKLDHVLWRALPVLRRVIPSFKPFRLFKPDFSDPETRDGILTFMPGIDLDDPDVQRSILDFEVPVSMMHQVHLTGQRAASAAPDIDMPALVIQGTQDELVQPRVTRDLITRFAHQPLYREVSADHNLLDSHAGAWQDVLNIVDHFIQCKTTQHKPAQGVAASW